MDIADISSEYQFIFNRLKKLNKSIEQIVKQNTQLKEANSKLRAEHGTWQNREAARERILSGISNRLQEVGDKPTDEGAREVLEALPGQ